MNSETHFRIVTFIVILVLVFDLSCTESKPTVQEWDYAINELGTWFASDMVFSYIQDTAEFQIDFLVTDERWFAAVISARKDTFGLVNSFVGKLVGNQLYYVNVDTNKILSGEFQEHFRFLSTNDSCWLLIDSIANLDEKRLKELWLKYIVFISSDGSKKELYSSLVIDKK